MTFSQEFWRHRKPLNFALLPASILFGAVVSIRQQLYKNGILPSTAASVPLIIVGNIVVGGGGKTPIVRAIVKELQQNGFLPGIACRGVGGKFADVSDVLKVDDKTPWQQCGDEALLLARTTGTPVCVGKNRVQVAQALTEQGCNIIVCDDGLQHYALQRDLEICAMHADFGLGNGWLLPAGPLRENQNRLATCDWLAISTPQKNTAKKALVANINHPKTANITIVNNGFYALHNPDTVLSAQDFADKKIAAIAGIAAPQRFFDSLRNEGINLNSTHALSDHAQMDSAKLTALPEDIILMTEKDAVKYTGDSRLHALQIVAHLPSDLIAAILTTAKRDKLA